MESATTPAAAQSGPEAASTTRPLDPRSLRLVRGCHLYPAPSGNTWRIAVPDGTFLRLRLSDDAAAALLQVLMASPEGDASASTIHTDDPGLAAFFDELDRRGLIDHGSTSRPSLAHRRAVVLGANPIARAFSDLLTAEGVGRVDVLAEVDVPPLGVATGDVVVACTGWLPDRSWRALDLALVEMGVVWHRAYLEGGSCFLGPMTIPGVTASYADLRARRLAAAQSPDELEAYWAFLDGSAPATDWPGAEGCAVIAGLLAADVLAILRGAEPPSAGHEVEVDLTRFVLDRHPVLPLPAELL